MLRWILISAGLIVAYDPSAFHVDPNWVSSIREYLLAGAVALALLPTVTRILGLD